jgi:hypothetical protein
MKMENFIYETLFVKPQSFGMAEGELGIFCRFWDGFKRFHRFKRFKHRFQRFKRFKFRFQRFKRFVGIKILAAL